MLGNLSTKVTADVSGFLSAMDLASKAAMQGMASSSGSVDAFRSSLVQSSADMQKAALAMGSNMAAANDAIVASADKSTAAIDGISKAVDNVDTRSMSEKVAFGLGAGVGAGIEASRTALETFVSYVKTRLIIVGLAIVTGIAAAVFTAVYAAYKVVGAISSMMDGTFFKSENIDLLIKANKELLEMQTDLHISSIEAGALNEALKRLGIDKTDYSKVFKDAATAARDNGKELDRLGVKYKDSDGKLLETNQVIQNAKGVLETYTEGWDRNKAATAIGMGSYEKLSSVLKVTTTEIQTSKSRLDDYQLGVTTGTQEMVTKYETAMREFSRENDLAGQGFKRVYADAIMPIYTDMANMFKEGWPSIVQATRVAVSSVLVIFYGLKNGFYIVTESILAALSALGSGLGGIGTAIARFMSGDLSGASKALTAGWDGAKDRLKLAGDGIVAQITENNKRIAAAAATDGRDASLASSKLPQVKKGKAWKDADKDDEKNGPAGLLDDVAKRIMEGKLKVQEDFIADEKTLLQTREMFLRNYYADDAIGAQQYYSTSQGLIQDNFAIVQEAYKKEIAAIEEYIKIHKTESDKQADIVNAQNKIAEIRRKMVQEEISTNTELAISYLTLSNERSNIANSLMKDVEAEEKFNSSRVSKITAWRDVELGNAAKGNKDLEREAARHRLAMIAADVNDRKTAIENQAVLLQNAKSYADQVKGYWLAANANVLSAQQQMAQMSATAMQSATDGIASSVSQAIVYGKSLGDSLKSVAMSVADAFITSFIKMQIQKVLIDKVTQTAYATTIAAQAQAMVAMAALAAFASTAAIPIVGPLAAPGAAAAAGAAAEVLAGTATAAAALSVASAEGGYDIPAGVNPMTQLHQKEMVLPEAQAEVIRGLAKSGGAAAGGAITIVNQTSAKIGKVIEQRLSSGDRALIIQEAVAATAAQFGDPNSKTSKAMSSSFTIQRSRT
jgi:hypothetical protein